MARRASLIRPSAHDIAAANAITAKFPRLRLTSSNAKPSSARLAAIRISVTLVRPECRFEGADDKSRAGTLAVRRVRDDRARRPAPARPRILCRRIGMGEAAADSPP